MAIEKILEIRVENKQAQRDMDALTAKIQEQKQITLEFERELKALERQLRDTPKNAIAAQKDLTLQINEVKDALVNQRASLRELNLQRENQAPVNTAIKGNNELAKSFKLNRHEVSVLNGLSDMFGSQLYVLANMFGISTQAAQGFVTKLIAMRAALIATGIGALVVALGAIVAYWDDIVDFIVQAEKAQQNYIKSLKLTKDLNESQLSLLDKQIKLAEENNESTEELVLKKKELLIEQIQINNKLLAGLELELEQEKSAGQQLTFWQKMQAPIAKILQMFGSDTMGKNLIQEVDLERAQRLSELEEKILAIKGETIDFETILVRLNRTKNETKEEELKIDRSILDQLKERMGILAEIEAAENEFLQSQLDRQTQEENAVREKYFRLIELAKQQGEDMALLEEAQRTALQEIADRYQAEKEEKQRQTAQRELDIYQQLWQNLLDAQQAFENAKADLAFAGLGLLQNVFGKFKGIATTLLLIEKSLAISQVITRASVAIAQAQAAAAPSPLNPPFLAPFVPNPSFIATQVTAAKSILATKLGAGTAIASILSQTIGSLGGKTPSGGSAGSSGGGGGGAGSPQQPNFNLIGDRGGVSQVQEGLQDGETPPVRAYVVSGEITTQQQLDNNAQSQAAF